jgi:hypothetical protein
MASISNEQPPIETAIELREYLSRRFIEIGIALGQSKKFPPIYILPDKPQDGNVEYFGQIIGATITSIGFWGYENGVWIKL